MHNINHNTTTVSIPNNQMRNNNTTQKKNKQKPKRVLASNLNCFSCCNKTQKSQKPKINEKALYSATNTKISYNDQRAANRHDHLMNEYKSRIVKSIEDGSLVTQNNEKIDIGQLQRMSERKAQINTIVADLLNEKYGIKVNVKRATTENKVVVQKEQDKN